MVLKSVNSIFAAASQLSEETALFSQLFKSSSLLTAHSTIKSLGQTKDGASQSSNSTSKQQVEELSLTSVIV